MRILGLLMIALVAPAAHAAYKCVDEKGFTHIGDTPPAGCANVLMYEVSKSGMVLRRIEPTPSPEEVKLKESEALRKREADKAAAEQKRKDLALLASFSAEREFDVARDRNIEPVRNRISGAQERIAAIEEREKKLLEEMEFYKAGKRTDKAAKEGKNIEAPPVLVYELQRAKAERAGLEKSITGYEREIEQLKTKFETDKKRWLAIKASGLRLEESKVDAKKTY